MPELDHEMKIWGTPQQVFAALTTAQGLAGWYVAKVLGNGAVGSEWSFEFADHHQFVWQIRQSDPGSESASDSPAKVVWTCVHGPGDSVGTTATFLISSDTPTFTLVELQHAGWPGTHGNFRKCNTLWGVLLHHLRDYVQTGTPAPAFR